MENRAENMEPINAVCENEAPKTERSAITTADILRRIDQIIEQGFIMQHTVMQIKELAGNECPDGGMDGAARAEAIRDIHVQREMTNRQMLTFLNRMYDDIAPKQVPIGLKEKAIERLSNMGFAGVEPETAKVLMDTLNNLLM